MKKETYNQKRERIAKEVVEKSKILREFNQDLDDFLEKRPKKNNLFAWLLIIFVITCVLAWLTLKIYFKQFYIF
jgi:hypothetical protein